MSWEIMETDAFKACSPFTASALTLWSSPRSPLIFSATASTSLSTKSTETKPSACASICPFISLSWRLISHNFTAVKETAAISSKIIMI